MRRLFPLFALLCLAVAAMPAPAGAAKKAKAKVPTIKKVSPMRVAVGRTITIRGKNFSPSRRKNTVVFRSPGKRTAFAKPRRASRTKLVVRVPGSVERLLKKSGTRRVPTRFTLRVVTKRYGKRTPRRLSPMIVSATETGNLDCGKGTDFDGDLLSNSREKTLKTDPCLADTDTDGVEDYFEVESALDLNQRAVSVPRQAPLPERARPERRRPRLRRRRPLQQGGARHVGQGCRQPGALAAPGLHAEPRRPRLRGPLRHPPDLRRALAPR